MCLVAAWCVTLAIASRFTQGLAVLVPPMLGPLTAWSILPTWRSTVWGFMSAYFWTVFALLPVAGIWAIEGLGAPSGERIVLIGGIAGALFNGFSKPTAIPNER